MPRLLYITTGLYFDPDDIHTRMRYSVMSDAGHSGMILSVAYDKDKTSREIGNFKTISLYLPPILQGYGPLRGIVRAIWYTLFSLLNAVRLRDEYDICIATDTFKTGAICLLTHIMAGRPYVLEVAGNYARSFSVNSRNAGALEKVKQSYVKRITPLTIKYAAAIKLLYPTQLDELVERLDADRIHVFHDITASESIRASGVDRRYILSVGHPWHLKGMDILIKAFLKIHASFPDYRLVIAGYCPDVADFAKLADNHPEIELLHKGIPHSDVIKLMSECSIFALASRTEAMGRVLLEAMASRKPIVASRVDGIPNVIRDNENGLLFEPESIDDLAEKLTVLLRDKDRSERLASQGLNDFEGRFSVESFVNNYNIMLRKAIPEKF